MTVEFFTMCYFRMCGKAIKLGSLQTQVPLCIMLPEDYLCFIWNINVDKKPLPVELEPKDPKADFFFFCSTYHRVLRSQTHQCGQVLLLKAVLIRKLWKGVLVAVIFLVKTDCMFCASSPSSLFGPRLHEETAICSRITTLPEPNSMCLLWQGRIC